MAWITPWEDERSALTTLAPPNVMPPTRSNPKKCVTSEALHHFATYFLPVDTTTSTVPPEWTGMGPVVSPRL
jgi:hypothetical protein